MAVGIKTEVLYSDEFGYSKLGFGFLKCHGLFILPLINDFFLNWNMPIRHFKKSSNIEKENLHS